MASLIAGVALAAALAACTTSSKPAPKPTHPATAAATAAPVATTPAQPAAEASWEQTGGYQSWIDVGNDVQQMGSDLNAGNTLALMGTGGAGFTLAEAASAALGSPSPVDTRAYKRAMANFGFAGVSTDNGNWNDAATFMKKALARMQAWATQAQPGATGEDGCGAWNLSADSQNC